MPDTDNDSSAVVTPTDASVTRFPVTVRLSEPDVVPSTVLLNRTAPVFFPSTVDAAMSPVSVTAFSNTTSPPSVVTSPAVEMPLAPRSVTAVPLALSDEMSPAAESVSTVPASSVTTPTVLIAASIPTVVVPVRSTVEPPAMACFTATLVAAVTDTAPVARMPDRAFCGTTASTLPIVTSSVSRRVTTPVSAARRSTSFVASDSVHVPPTPSSPSSAAVIALVCVTVAPFVTSRTVPLPAAMPVTVTGSALIRAESVVLISPMPYPESSRSTTSSLVVVMAIVVNALPLSASVRLPSASTARLGDVMAEPPASPPTWLIVPPAVVDRLTVCCAKIGLLIAIEPAALSRTQSLRSSAVRLIGASMVMPPVRAFSSR